MNQLSSEAPGLIQLVEAPPQLRDDLAWMCSADLAQCFRHGHISWHLQADVEVCFLLGTHVCVLDVSVLADTPRVAASTSTTFAVEISITAAKVKLYLTPRTI